MKLAVFTAIFGERDQVREPLCDVDYFVFTDQPTHSSFAKVVQIKAPFRDPVRSARAVKVMSHKFMPEYDFTLWLDANFSLKSVDGLLEHLKDGELAVSRHYLRNCAYEEAEEIVKAGKDAGDVVRFQMEQYRRENYPASSGLVETGALLRKRSKAVERFNEAWWSEIAIGSRRDQLSFNYVAWKLGFDFRLFPWDDVRSAPFWSYTDHTGEEPAL